MHFTTKETKLYLTSGKTFVLNFRFKSNLRGFVVSQFGPRETLIAYESSELRYQQRILYSQKKALVGLLTPFLEKLSPSTHLISLVA